jgi:hypothetical protein
VQALVAVASALQLKRQGGRQPRSARERRRVVVVAALLLVPLEFDIELSFVLEPDDG